MLAARNARAVSEHTGGDAGVRHCCANSASELHAIVAGAHVDESAILVLEQRDPGAGSRN